MKTLKIEKLGDKQWVVQYIEPFFNERALAVLPLILGAFPTKALALAAAKNMRKSPRRG